MRLVDDWKTFPLWFENHAHVLNVVVVAVWEALPDGFRDSLPVWWVVVVVGLIAVLGIAGSLVEQK